MVRADEISPPSTNGAENSGGLPLAGVKVVDLTRVMVVRTAP